MLIYSRATVQWPLRTAILAGLMNVVIWFYFFYKVSVELPAVIGEIPQAELPGYSGDDVVCRCLYLADHPTNRK